MGWQHGKDTDLSVDGKVISAWTNNSELTRGAAGHNVTAYGTDDEAWSGGVRNGKFTCSGIYDNTVTTGPHDVLDPKVGTVVPVIRRGEGVGTGKPEQAFSGLLVSYVETNPVADMVTWSAEFTVSGGVIETTQA